MDANLTRDHLARLLAEEITALTEFEDLLESEHAALKARDIDALEALADARQHSVTRMLKLEDERRGLCGMLGYDTDLAGLAKLLAWCDPRRSLAAAYDECAGRARRCRDLNDRNGILVGAQIKRVEGLLGAITGAPAQRSYGPRQGGYHAPAAGQVISAEA
ncbi:MAG TPA: flagellar protein FlgN [Steroidobacteraceae bacterium]|nr:flagellar protein FlgN [Steroidobacteraceae bacterium]